MLILLFSKAESRQTFYKFHISKDQYFRHQNWNWQILDLKTLYLILEKLVKAYSSCSSVKNWKLVVSLCVLQTIISYLPPLFYNWRLTLDVQQIYYLTHFAITAFQPYVNGKEHACSNTICFNENHAIPWMIKSK